MSRIVSADEARKLLNGIAATPWRVAPHDDPGAGEVQDSDGYYVNAEGDADAQIMAAAPDLAATVIRLHEERDQAQITAADLIEIIGETAWGIQLPTLFVRGPIMLPDGTIGTSAIPTALAPESAKQLVEHLYERATTGREWLREARRERDTLAADCDRQADEIMAAYRALRATPEPTVARRVSALCAEVVAERDRLRDILNCETGKSAPGNWTRNDVDPKREGIAWYRRWEADGSEPGEEDTDQTRVAWVRHDSEADMTTWCWEIEAPTLGAFGKQIAHGENYATAYEAIEACDKCAEVGADDAKENA